jgi:LysM repeat protein
MNRRFYILIPVVVAILMLILAACTRTASVAPGSAQQTEVPFAVGTVPANALEEAKRATETALALTKVPTVAITPVPKAQPTAVPEKKEENAIIPTPVITRPATYTLQRGEWPICIARRYNLDLNSFFAANGLNMNSKPAVGTVLVIPQTGTWSSNWGPRALRPHPDKYTVQAGDTIYTIACRYGDVHPDSIIAVNGLSDGNVKVGQVLQIP